MMSGRISRKQSTNKAPLVRTEKIVQNLKKLPDGWGGDMSKKPTVKAVRKIKKVLTALESGHMPWPNITVTANGGIILTWISLSRDILMTVDTDGDIQFVTSLKKLEIDTCEIIDRLDSEGAITDMQSIDYMMAWFATDKAHPA